MKRQNKKFEFSNIEIMNAIVNQEDIILRMKTRQFLNKTMRSLFKMCQTHLQNKFQPAAVYLVDGQIFN